jgi:hypothetical protein
MSKGSGRRPSQLSQDEWVNRWDSIFGKDLDKKKAVEDALDDLYEQAIKPTENKHDSDSRGR